MPTLAVIRRANRRPTGPVVLAVVAVVVVGWAAFVGFGNAPGPAARPAPPVGAADAGGPSAPETAADEPERSAAGAPPPAVADAPAEPSADAPTDQVPRLVEQLPEELREPLRQALAGCAHACQMLGLAVPDWRVSRITLADAREVIAREAELRRRSLAAAAAMDRELQTRLEANPGLGVQFAAAERAEREATLQARYPGWPDGYVYIEESDAGTVRILAVLVADDPILRELEREVHATSGEYAWVVRSGYRLLLRP